MVGTIVVHGTCAQNTGDAGSCHRPAPTVTPSAVEGRQRPFRVDRRNHTLCPFGIMMSLKALLDRPVR